MSDANSYQWTAAWPRGISFSGPRALMPDEIPVTAELPLEEYGFENLTRHRFPTSAVNSLVLIQGGSNLSIYHFQLSFRKRTYPPARPAHKCLF